MFNKISTVKIIELKVRSWQTLKWGEIRSCIKFHGFMDFYTNSLLFAFALCLLYPFCSQHFSRAQLRQNIFGKFINFRFFKWFLMARHKTQEKISPHVFSHMLLLIFSDWNIIFMFILTPNVYVINSIHFSFSTSQVFNGIFLRSSP